MANECHRSENADRTSPQNDRAQTSSARIFGSLLIDPRQTALHMPDLLQPLLGDRKRLDKNSYLAEIVRNRVQEFFFIDVEFRHEAMCHLDSAFREISRKTKILPVFATALAV